MLKKISDKVFLSPPVSRPEHIQALQEAKVSHVINASAFENDHILEEGGFTYCRLNFIDNGKEQDPILWETALRFIEKAWGDPDAKIAIHCIGGPRRSVSIAYLILRMQDVSHEGALQYLALVTTDQPIYAEFINAWWTTRQTGMVFPKGGA